MGKLKFVFHTLLLAALTNIGCSHKPVGQEDPEKFQTSTASPIRKTVQAHLKEFKDCIRDKEDKLQFPAQVVLEWQILESGKVNNIEVKGSNTQHSDFDQCLATKVKNWEFKNIAKTKNLKFVVVNYPFDFSTPKKKENAPGPREELFEKKSD